MSVNSGPDLTAVDLLSGDAGKAGEIPDGHRPSMTKENYLEFQDRLFQTENCDYGSVQEQG